LELLFDDTVLSTATGFFWSHPSGPFLVTNWHVVTGKHPETGKHLSSHAGEPNRLRAYVTPSDNLGAKRACDVKLHGADGRPLWLVHPDQKEGVDIAIIPVRLPADAHMQALNQMTAAPAKLFVGDDVFVLGFPLGPRDGMPIWKRASVATEPDGGGPSDPMLIDTATRPGMSGSPVIWRGAQYFAEANNTWVHTTGNVSRFLGIYSGRVAAKDTIEAQLGLVWRASLIEEIIAANRRDTG
jgi:S1-C subfamily serine protease